MSRSGLAASLSRRLSLSVPTAGPPTSVLKARSCPSACAPMSYGKALKLPLSPFPYQIAVSPDSKVVYASNGQVGQLYRIDVASRPSVTAVRLGAAGQWAAGPAVFGTGGQTLYVLSWTEQQTPRTVYVGLLTPVDDAHRERRQVGPAARRPRIHIVRTLTRPGPEPRPRIRCPRRVRAERPLGRRGLPARLQVVICARQQGVTARTATGARQ